MLGCWLIGSSTSFASLSLESDSLRFNTSYSRKIFGQAHRIQGGYSGLDKYVGWVDKEVASECQQGKLFGKRTFGRPRRIWVLC
jgi:hypothetical protein